MWWGSDSEQMLDEAAYEQYVIAQYEAENAKPIAMEKMYQRAKSFGDVKDEDWDALVRNYTEEDLEWAKKKYPWVTWPKSIDQKYPNLAALGRYRYEERKNKQRGSYGMAYAGMS